MKEYAKAASEMTREELEKAYVKCKFGRTIFSELPENYYSDVFFNEEE